MFKRRLVEIGAEQGGLVQIRKRPQARRTDRRSRRDLRRQRVAAMTNDDARVRSCCVVCIAFCLSRRPLVLIAFAAFLGARCYGAFSAAQHRGLSRSGAADHRDHRAISRPVARGDGALRHDPDRDRGRQHAGTEVHPLQLGLCAGLHPAAVRVWPRLPFRSPAGAQPAQGGGAAAERAAGDLARRHDQRNLPLSARAVRPAWTSWSSSTLQDWVVERRLRIVPGVSDVLVLGGKTKEFQAEIDLNRMRAYGLTLPQIIARDLGRATPTSAAARSRSASSRSTCAASASSARSRTSSNIVLTQQGGVPVLLSDVAKVQIGFRPRLGIVGPRRHHRRRHRHRADAEVRAHDGGRDARARRGRASSTPTARCRQACRSCRSTTAATWSRSPCETVLHNMLFGIVLIFLIQWLFLGNLRSARSSSRRPSRWRCCSPSSSRCCAANPPTCCRSARSISASSSMRPSSWWRTSSATSRTTPAGIRRPAGRLRRQAAPHPHRGGRGRQADLLFGDHHHRGVPAAVHHAGRGGPDLRPDGAHLCLRADRRGDRHLHHHAGARRSVLLPEKVQEVETIPGALASARSTSGILPLAVRHAGSRRRSRCALPDGRRRARRAARHRVPAQARRRQPVDPRGDAADHQARGRHGYGRAHPQDHPAAIRRCGPWPPSRAAATRAPIRTARSSPNSSCR